MADGFYQEVLAASKAKEARKAEIAAVLHVQHTVIHSEDQAALEEIVASATCPSLREKILAHAEDLEQYRMYTLWKGDLHTRFGRLNDESFTRKVVTYLRDTVRAAYGGNFTVGYSDEGASGSHSARQGRNASLTLYW